MYFTWILMILCVEILHGHRIPEEGSQGQQKHPRNKIVSETFKKHSKVMQQEPEHLEMFSTEADIEGITDWFQARNYYYYKLFDENATQAEAKATCKLHGGLLASAGIRDESVRRELVFNLLRTGNSDTWIGLNDIGEENKFIWEDGMPTRGILWYYRQPDNDGDQDCVEMGPGYNWRLNDEDCNEKNKYLCEIEP
uniref:C-type mannose receptor 2-like n=1 Tax=Styela clava TaxID=7725 RepID=UPI00193A71F3|nr:C-type mannose receptor 2-like [Styela clava]